MHRKIFKGLTSEEATVMIIDWTISRPDVRNGLVDFTTDAIVGPTSVGQRYKPYISIALRFMNAFGLVRATLGKTGRISSYRFVPGAFEWLLAARVLVVEHSEPPLGGA